MADKILNRLRRRLESAELQHLRQLAADQHAEIERLQNDLYNAEHIANYWNDHAIALQRELYELSDGARQVGITQDGALLIVHADKPTQEPAP